MTEEFEKVKCKICGEVMGADKAAAHEHDLWAIMGLIPTDIRGQVAEFLNFCFGRGKLWKVKSVQARESWYRVATRIDNLYTPLIEQARQEGRQEVVEFVEGNIPKTLANYVGFWHNWQTKLKEWSCDKPEEVK